MQYNTLPDDLGQLTQSSLIEKVGVDCVSLSQTVSQGAALVASLTPSHISPRASQRDAVQASWQRAYDLMEIGSRRSFPHASLPRSKSKTELPEPTRMIRHVDSETGEITEVPDPDTGLLRVMQDGELLQVKKPKGLKQSVRRGGGKRGIVFGVSAAGQRNMKRTISSLDKSIKPLFVTLTYPLEFPLSYLEWKRHLDVFAKRFARKFSDGAIIWRLEPQKRGAPHYHMFVYGVEFTAENRIWFANVWYQIVNSGDEKHLRRGTDFQQLGSFRGVKSYISKYIGKRQSPTNDEVDDQGEKIDWNRVGRWWGIKCRKNLPWSEEVKVDQLTYRESVVAMRNMRRYLKSQGVRVSGCLPSLTIYVNDPKQWLSNIDGLCGGVHHTKHSYQSVSAKWQC